MLLGIADMQVRGTDVGALMRAALEGLAGRTDDDMAAFGERIFRDAIAGMVYPAARELVRAHRRAGHTVVIATSATRYQVEPLARDLGADGLLCTQAEVVDGVLTGATDGPILWGEAKGDAIRAYAAGHGVDLDASFAYGNGNEEEPLLRAVG